MGDATYVVRSPPIVEAWRWHEPSWVYPPTWVIELFTRLPSPAHGPIARVICDADGLTPVVLITPLPVGRNTSPQLRMHQGDWLLSDGRDLVRVLSDEAFHAAYAHAPSQEIDD